MKSRAIALAAALLGLVASTASAQNINRRVTGLAAPSYTIDFNNIASGTVPTTINDVNFGGLWSVEPPSCAGGTFSTQSAYNFGCSSGRPLTDPVSLLFTSPVTGVAFNIITNPTTTTFTAFLGATQVGSFSGATDLTTPERFWYGFEGFSFDRIEMTSQVTSTGIDNIQVSVAPEPSSVVLMLAGLAALGVVARRRRIS